MSQRIYDSIRETWVEASPEEIVRQKLLAFMVDHLGYPKHLIAVEKKLSEFPTLRDQKMDLPNRRIDVVCFAQGSLSPLLLIECKATKIEKKMFAQLFGYNAFIQAPYTCLTNHKETIFCWLEASTGDTHYLDTIPPFEALTCNGILLS